MDKSAVKICTFSILMDSSILWYCIKIMSSGEIQIVEFIVFFSEKQACIMRRRQPELFEQVFVQVILSSVKLA